MKKYVDNVLRVYEACSELEKNASKDWYLRARAWCEHRAQVYGMRVRTVAAVVSALSPRNKWERNLLDADQLLYYASNGYSAAMVVSSTFEKNVLKAYDIVEFDKPELVETGPKTRSFLDCIDNPKCDAVVVDVWAYRVIEGDLKLKAVGFSDECYEKYADAYRRAADEVELLPMQIQAITWVAARSRKRKKTAMNQMSMF